MRFSNPTRSLCPQNHLTVVQKQTLISRHTVHPPGNTNHFSAIPFLKKNYLSLPANSPCYF